MMMPPDEARPLGADDVEAIDSLARSLPTLSVPDELLARTRAAMAVELDAAGAGAAPEVTPARIDAEVVPLRPRRVGWSLGAVAALAAAGLVFILVPRAPAPAPPDRLVERGAGDRLPDVALKVAVRDGRATRRHDPGVPVAVGTQLYFRVGVDQDAELALVRVDGRGAVIVHAQGASAGEADLTLEDAPLAWAVESGEGDAVFALLASGEPIDRAAIEAALGDTDDSSDADSVCQAALALGTRCDATVVKVNP